MDDQVYRKLAGVLDTLPNGFPATESGIEIKLLKKIFTPEEAELFCELKMTPETPEQISKRIGRPIEILSRCSRQCGNGVRSGDLMSKE